MMADVSKAPGSNFFHRDVLRFYVFLSLPSVWLAEYVTPRALISVAFN
jgi:hypothetical protein